jgi:DNA-binding transcriptional ArsR family regulator
MTNAQAILTALGDPSRQAILDSLSDGPRAVGELAAELSTSRPISRPAVSQHLKVLKEAGLVIDEQVGTRRLYRVDPEALRIVREHLDGFWERSLSSFQRATAEKPPEKDKPDE